MLCPVVVNGLAHLGQLLCFVVVAVAAVAVVVVAAVAVVVVVTVVVSVSVAVAVRQFALLALLCSFVCILSIEEICLAETSISVWKI